MIRARFSPKAESDLLEINKKIAADNFDAANRVRTEILIRPIFWPCTLNLGGELATLAPAIFKSLVCYSEVSKLPYIL